MSISPVSFGYSHKLKTLYKQGKLPTVVKGFYGGVLTPDTVTLEHLKPHCEKGKTSLENLVLATANNNHRRGNKPLQEYLNPQAMEEYLAQFKDLKIKNFNGNDYIKKVQKTIERLINV